MAFFILCREEHIRDSRVGLMHQKTQCEYGEEFYRSFDPELSDRRRYLRFDEPGEQRGRCCHLCQSRCQRRQAAALTGSSAEPARFDQK